MAVAAPPTESRFDLMSDLCILAGQAVMQVGSSELQSAMRVVLTVLGRELAARSVRHAAEASETHVPGSAGKRRSRVGARVCTGEFA